MPKMAKRRWWSGRTGMFANDGERRRDKHLFARISLLLPDSTISKDSMMMMTSENDQSSKLKDLMMMM